MDKILSQLKTTNLSNSVEQYFHYKCILMCLLNSHTTYFCYYTVYYINLLGSTQSYGLEYKCLCIGWISKPDTRNKIKNYFSWKEAEWVDETE